MLNLPTDGEADAAHRPASPRQLVRRRPLTGGERRRGWADVRELPTTDEARIPKYHVDLNVPAQLDWAEWQRLCAAEPLQPDAPIWCMLTASGASDDDSERPEDDEHTPAHERRNATPPVVLLRPTSAPEAAPSGPSTPSA